MSRSKRRVGTMAQFFLSALAASALAQSSPSWDHSLYTSSPPVYPSPQIKGLGDWAPALAKANSFLAQLTLDEKALLLTGTPGPCIGNISPIPRIGFPGLCLQDGPLAIRQADNASVFPAGITVAASWDVGLLYRRGVGMGEEFRGKGAHVALGPVAGPLGRNALGGRNWEGFSPDPYLTGVAMEHTIQGIQSTGVQACAKHYIGNEQETQRNPTGTGKDTIEAVSSNIDDRTMHELYLWPFVDAVHAGVASVMCSYNRVNGSYGCQNSKTLNGILKDELNFQGYVMSDWQATHSGVASVLAGLDMDMPGGFNSIDVSHSFFGGNLTAAVKNGSIPEARIDDMIRRVMTPYFHLNQDAPDFPTIDPSGAALNPSQPKFTWTAPWVLNGTSARNVRADHKALIREIAARSTVLLKNTNNVLPLAKPASLAVFGSDAGNLTHGLYSITLDSNSYETGTLAVGGGSGTGKFTELISPLTALSARAVQDGTKLTAHLFNNYTAADVSALLPTAPTACLVFIKTYAAENQDRASFGADWHGDALVATVASQCANTMVITHSAGINTLPWSTHPNVTGILLAHLPGEQTGNALVDVLYGDVNPSGRLPYTIAKNESDYPAPITVLDPGNKDPNAWQADFVEGTLIDYRHFEAMNVTPAYEFGFGLSYTTFALSDLVIKKVIQTPITPLPPPVAPEGMIPGGNPTLWDALYHVSATVTNTGQRGGEAVVQLYVTLPGAQGGKWLRGFAKVSVDANGGTAAVGFDLRRRDLSGWDAGAQQWRVGDGEVGVGVGFSSRDLRLKGTVRPLS